MRFVSPAVWFVAACAWMVACGGSSTSDGGDASDASATDVMHCAAPTTACGASCVDLMTSVLNCGGCDRLCTSGGTCVGGVCQLSTMCASNSIRCGEQCVDPNTDNSHCGNCMTAC